MPKEPAVPILNIDLLKSQGSSQKLTLKAFKWVLSAGRYLIIFVELIVLIAFLTRFFLDAQIEGVKDDISKLSVFVESLKPQETEIRNVQSQLASIKKAKGDSFDFESAISKIANQTPPGVNLSNVTFERQGPTISLRLSGIAKTNLDLSTFAYGLKSDSSFSDIDIANIDLEQNALSFSITGDMK